jgi:hypothetical protein
MRALLTAMTIALALTGARVATAQDADTSAVSFAPPAAPKRALEALDPALAEHPYQLAPGVRPYQNRLAFSPGYGWFGSDPLFVIRAAYQPSNWLGYEASLAHNPSPSVHAVLHTLSAIVRRPVAGRLQPYLTAGYGMIVVFPGRAVDATAVTKNSLSVGGGLECFIRNDLALRADLRHAIVFGQQRGHEGVVTYPYSQGTIGLSFYRTVQP